MGEPVEERCCHLCIAQDLCPFTEAGDDEKRTICAQTLTAGVSVAQVAGRYAMNANLIFKWLKDPR